MIDEKKEWMRRISMHDFCKIDDNIYFFALNFNGLFKMDLKDRKLEYLGSAPNEGDYSRHLYGAITESNGKLYMPPMHGKEIAIYDIKKKSIKKISLKYEAENMMTKFYGALTYNGKVYFIPGRYPYLVVIDSYTEEVMYYDDWKDKINIPSDYKQFYFRKGYFVRNNCLYMASMLENVIVKIPLDTYISDIVRITDDSIGFTSMHEDYDGEHIWFSQQYDSRIIRWNEKTNNVVVYDKFPEGFVHEEIPFVGLVLDGDYLYAVAFQSNMTIKMNKKTGEMSKVEWDIEPEENALNRWGAKHYFVKKIEENEFLVANIDDNSFYITDGDKLKEKIYLIYEYSRDKIKFASNSIQRENDQYKLIDYIKYIADGV